MSLLRSLSSSDWIAEIHAFAKGFTLIRNTILREHGHIKHDARLVQTSGSETTRHFRDLLAQLWSQQSLCRFGTTIFVENSIGSNCCSSKSRVWRPSGTRCSTQNKPKRRLRRRCCWVSVALGRSSLRSSGLKDSPDSSITADRSPLMPALPRGVGKAGRVVASRARDGRATRVVGQQSSRWPGFG